MLDALMCADPAQKCERVRALKSAFDAHTLNRDETASNRILPVEIPIPGRPDRPLLVPPRQLIARRLGSIEGRAALIHAVAHIEFNAINLALDAAYRFRGMPEAFYADWLLVAADEARHFEMLVSRLQSLGFSYGDFPAHNGLWETACNTAHSCLIRMALVPRVLEARGLDVTPGMIERLRSVGDSVSAEVLAIILREEVAHVAIGTRWFLYCCDTAGVEPESTFLDLIRAHAGNMVRKPFNVEARQRAGFTVSEQNALEQLADLH